MESMRHVVASWLYPPRIDVITPPSQVVYEGYAFAQRSHEFRLLTETGIEFEVTPTAAVVNPVFVLNRWPADDVVVQWGSRTVDPEHIVTQREGDDLVVWIKGEITYPLRLRISAP